MLINFNYDNHFIFIGVYPQYACGQFLMNCLSLANELCPVGNDMFVTSCLSGADQDHKIRNLLECLPKRSDAYWHQRFYNSTRWFTNVMWAKSSMDIDDQSTGTIASGLIDTMRPYMNLRWRDHAKKVSNSQLGMFLPGHDQSELKGWQQLFGDRKHFTVQNYHKIRQQMVKAKTNNDLMVKAHDEGDYRLSGFVFDIERLIGDDVSFISQMAAAYEYFNLNGLSDRILRDYKKAYLAACVQFRSN